MDYTPKCKLLIVRLLEGNVGENLDGLVYDSNSLGIKPKTHFMKERIDKLGFIQVKSFFSTKDTVKRMKRQAQTEIKYLQKYV